MSRRLGLRHTLPFTSALLILPLAALPASAGESVRNVSVASGQSVKATGQLALSGIKVVVGAVAAPFVIIGGGTESVGRAIKDSGRAVWDNTNTPLEVSDATMTAQDAPNVPYNAQGKVRTAERERDAK